MKYNSGDRQRGDTLIEVLIAVTILGIVVVGAMSIMNRMMISMLNSAERTAVRAEMNGQAELLQYIKVNEPDVWNRIKNRTSGLTAAEMTTRATTSCASYNNYSFYIRADLAGVTLTVPTTAATNPVNVASSTTGNPNAKATVGNGIWIDPVYHPAVTGGNRVAY